MSVMFREIIHYLPVILVVGLPVFVLLFFYRKHGYWARKGLPYVQPHGFFGNVNGMGTTRNSSVVLKECYDELKGKAVCGGIYFITKPVVIPTNLDFIKQILIKDFFFFHDRGIYMNERADPLSAHLFSMEGSQWRSLRYKLSPTFTTGKMKQMHSTMLRVAGQLKDYLDDLAYNGVDLEFKELFAQFSTDIIGNVAFGIECNSLSRPHNEFREYGRKVFDITAWNVMKNFFVTIYPKLGRLLNLGSNKPEVAAFFMKLLHDTVDYREKNNVKKNDFLDLLIQVKNTGIIDGENIGLLTFDELAAQTFIFFIAGFESPSSTMAFALYELAVNRDIQDKARQEVIEIMDQHDNTLTYEAALKMKYLEQIISETLRKYPPVDLFRKVTHDYTIDGTDIVLEKDTMMMVSIFGIHRDPELYPEPDKFDPERFTPEMMAKRHPMAYLPFGDGPRNCIGNRFGLMQIRIALATILKNYLVKPNHKTPIPLVLKPNAAVLTPLSGIDLHVQAL